MDAADLDVVLVGDSFECCHVLRKLGKLDVDWGSHGCTEIGWAWSDVTKMFVMSELDNSLDVGSCAWESVENSVDVSALLHRDDTELILFVNPHKEGLFFVVEDTSAIGPVAVKASDFKETVSLPKKVE